MPPDTAAHKGSLAGDFNARAASAGLTAFIYYAFGAIPLHLAVASQLGLNQAQSSSWIFIVWFSGAIASIALSLVYRQPIPITWTTAGLIYMGTLAGNYSYPELVGASLMAGLVILALSLGGLGGRIISWLPLPIILGMFAGSILGYITRLVGATVGEFLIAGPTVAGYIAGRMIKSSKVPPMGLAVLFGAAAICFVGTEAPVVIPWSLPVIAVPEMAFSLQAFVAISLPLVILSMGMGNVQGLGFLISQGYRVPINAVSIIVGVTSVINAIFGGHPAIVARIGVSILAAPEAGPPATRYWGNLLAASLTFFIALGAGTIAALLGVLPRSFALALAGLAVLGTFQDALLKAFGGELRFGALIAFAVAVTPFAFAGITSAFWAVIVGVVVSLLLEREELMAYWKREEKKGG